MLIDNMLLVDRGRFLEAEMRALLGLGRLAGAQPGPQHRRPQGPDRRLRARRERAAAGRRRAGPRRGRRLYGPRHGLCRRGGAAADRAARGRRLQLRNGQWRQRLGRDPGRSRGADRDGRFRGHQRSAAEQFQRAFFDLPGGDALRVPHHGRRCDTAQRRLHAADPPEGARRLDAQSALSGGGGRRKCRDQPGDHRLPVRRCRRACAEPGHDEQFHVRQ